MKWVMIPALLAFHSALSQGDAKPIVEKSKNAIQSLRSVHLNVLYKDDYFGQTSADIVISREKPFAVFGISKVKMTGVVVSSTGSKPISQAFDGSTFYYTDTEKNEIVQIQNPTYSKLGRSGQLNYGMAIPAVYFEGAVLDTIMKQAVGYELLADTVIFNQPSHSVKIARDIYNKFTGDMHRSETVWFFHKDSYLPLGTRGKGSNNFYKIKSTNQPYVDEEFILTGNIAMGPLLPEVKQPAYLSLNSDAPDWTLPSNKQGPITLSQLKGKVVMLDFWGTWCAPCLKSMPAVQSLHEYFKDQPVEIIGVSVEPENAVDVPAFVKRKGYTYPIALEGKNISKAYNVSQFPTIYIIDQKGKIIFAGPGENLEKEKDQVKHIIQQALLSK